MAPILTRLTQSFGCGAPSGGGGDASTIVATGGQLVEYSDGGTHYKAHIFTTTGTFTVSSSACWAISPISTVAPHSGQVPVSSMVAGLWNFSHVSHQGKMEILFASYSQNSYIVFHCLS